MSHWLAIDFGTSNSAAAHFCNGGVSHIPLEANEATMPTSVFFSFEERETVYGREADKRLIDGEEGRYMRSLKSVLGTSLMAEEQFILGRRVTFYDLITDIITHIKTQSEHHTGLKFSKVVAGRPVYFHSGDPERNAKAKSDLESCFKRAGFEQIEFMLEPEAATRSTPDLFQEGATGIVIDIGGGTSDFSIFKRENSENRVLASHGFRLGGTDFDRSINYDFFMPELGRGSDLNLEIGDGIAPAPNQIYSELSRWERIPFMYTAKNLKLAQQLIRQAVEATPFKNLLSVLQRRLGHDLAFRAEEAKINNNQATNDIAIDFSFIAEGLQKTIPASDFKTCLQNHQTRLEEEINTTLQLAGLRPTDIQHAVLVGGSSMMYLVHGAMRNTVPNAQPSTGEIFTAIVDGLALKCGELQKSI